MAKKTVATLQDKSKKNLSKLIITERSEKTGAYTFREIMVPTDKAKDYLK